MRNTTFWRGKQHAPSRFAGCEWTGWSLRIQPHLPPRAACLSSQPLGHGRHSTTSSAKHDPGGQSLLAAVYASLGVLHSVPPTRHTLCSQAAAWTSAARCLCVGIRTSYSSPALLPGWARPSAASEAGGGHPHRRLPLNAAALADNSPGDALQLQSAPYIAEWQRRPVRRGCTLCAALSGALGALPACVAAHAR